MAVAFASMRLSLPVQRGEFFIMQLKQFNYKTEQIVALTSYKNDFKSRLSLIVRVSVVLNRTVVVDSD